MKKNEFFEFNGDSTFIRLNSDPSILTRNPQFEPMIAIPPPIPEPDSPLLHPNVLNLKECKSV